MRMERTMESNVQPVWKDIFRGYVQKCVIDPGAGQVVPKEAEVRLALSMYLTHDSHGFHQSISAGQLLYRHSVTEPLVKLVSNILPIGLQKAVLTMCSGEKAKIWIDPLLAYGSSTLVFSDDPSKAIPPNAALFYEVHLIRWEVNELQFCVDRCGKLRFSAMPQINEMLVQAEKDFTDGKEKSALHSLCKVISMLDRMKISMDKQDQERKKVIFAASVLASVCALKVGKYPQAITFGRRVLEINPMNVDATHVLARAYFALGYNKSARYFAQRLWCYDVGNKQYKHTYDKIRAHVALIEGESEGDDEEDVDDYEQLAKVITEKREEPAVQKKLIKDLDKLLNSDEFRGISEIEIKGGFPPTLLDFIETKLRKNNQFIVISKSSPTSLELTVL
ncbi:70 kDa peptidyl-prolyl isomerase-like isoform X1 [Varroa destructor]|uniref:peptidylprolyl isomerase n=2 Tax=Varroa destructor TaxID=109461 RepID=A0A7M7JSZ2_VARDE|nr:70 kDa peptidyl-prolyl isomerase-like isoform X1 [Varroa destructor]